MRALLFIRLEQFRMLLKKSLKKTGMYLSILVGIYFISFLLTIPQIPFFHLLPSLLLVALIHATRTDLSLIHKTGLPTGVVYFLEYVSLLLPVFIIGIIFSEPISLLLQLVVVLILTFIPPARGIKTQHQE